MRRLRARLPPEVPLIGFAGAPWTLAAYMVEGARLAATSPTARALARRDPALFATLVDLLTAAVIDHLLAQVEAGADVVQLFDSWAGVLPEDDVQRWCVAPARRDRRGRSPSGIRTCR